MILHKCLTNQHSKCYSYVFITEVIGSIQQGRCNPTVSNPIYCECICHKLKKDRLT